MLNRLIPALALLHFLYIPTATASVIDRYVPQAEKVGEARMSVMMWDIYDAALFAPNGQWSGQEPFALRLVYLRDLKGDKIADRSIKEMRNQGFDDEVKLATWHTQLRQIFPNVSHGDELTGILTRNGQTLFYKGQARIGTITDSEFGQRFFDIWLSPKTSAPDIRYSLIGYETKGHDNHETIKRTISYGNSGVF